ncbi:restriction endonuclease subunit S [Owenweeksia hongkongensis]|uniref:restriction endonuclease subunit S n=1 Tax=Owenweeksia hongkongensis TaxID=253245 RepID=UPI003A8E064B
MIKYKSVPIDKIGDVVTGRTPKTSDQTNYGTEFMFVGPTDLHKHFVIRETEKTISRKGLDSVKSSNLKGVSVLVGCIGWDMGNVALIEEKCVTNQQINSITNVKPDHNPYYVYYWLKGKKDFLFQQASVTRTPILNKSTFSSIEIPVPERSYQDKVANILSSLDSKIELNNRINAELEAMAKTIYDYWFVQFDFPISQEMATQMGQPQLEGRPYKSSGGKMVYNEELKRDVPEGWGNYALSEIGDIIGGSTPSKTKEEYFTTGGNEIPWITPKDLSARKGKRFISYGECDVTEAGRKAASLKLMPKGTVLLSSRAPVGYMAIAREAVTTNQGFKSLVPVEGFSTEYVFLTVKLYLPAIIKKASGSTFAEISGSTLKTVEIAAPPQELIEKFTATVAPMFAKQDVLEQENQELASLRDWLLPMLMNGQVKVGEGKANKATYTAQQELDDLAGRMAAERREKYEVKE